MKHKKQITIINIICMVSIIEYHKMSYNYPISGFSNQFYINFVKKINVLYLNQMVI